MKAIIKKAVKEIEDLKKYIKENYLANDGGLTASGVDAIWMADYALKDLKKVLELDAEELEDLLEQWQEIQWEGEASMSDIGEIMVRVLYELTS